MLKLKSFVVAAALVASFGVAKAEETTLIFATTLPPVAAIVKDFLKPWAERVNQDGAGVVKLDVRDGQGLANHLTFYDRTINDVIQIGWGSQASVGGKFNLTNIVTLPFEGGEAEPTALALWRLYKTGQMDAEYDDVQPLVFVAFPQTGLHMSKPMATLDNLNGLKIAVVSKGAADAVSALGGAPITLSAPEFYEAINRKMVDGGAISTNGGQTFKLHELVTYHVDAPLGSTPAMLLMAKKKLAGLPEAARKVMLAHSGDGEVRTGGRFHDTQTAAVRQQLIASGNHSFVALSPAQEKIWREKTASIAVQWAKTTPGGEKALATYRELFAKAKMER
jgi:TRAP-type C4-dicarboxylate transport system substrate-binding protein